MGAQLAILCLVYSRHAGVGQASRFTGCAQPEVLSWCSWKQAGQMRHHAGRGTCGAPPHLNASHTAPAAASRRKEARPGAAYTGAASDMAGGRGTSMQRQRHSRSLTPSGRAWDSAEPSRRAARPATQRRCAMLCGVVLVLVTGRCRGWAGLPGGHAIAARRSPWRSVY
jgi:hypothetical protein